MLVYFPPRLISLGPSLDSERQIYDARDRYLDQGIAILGVEDQVRDALKVIEFARQFPEIHEVA